MSTRAASELAVRLAGGVWGHLVGDAVGVPYEFRDPVPVEKIRFGAQGTHGQPPGTWSDDGSVMLAPLDSLLGAGFDTEDQARRVVAWYREKAYKPDGDGAFDVGNTTRAAISAIERGMPAEQAGGTDTYSNGNRSLMRILPVALVYTDAADGDLVDMAPRRRESRGRSRRIALDLWGAVCGRCASTGRRSSDPPDPGQPEAHDHEPESAGLVREWAQAERARGGGGSGGIPS